ncbi:hypothetical protein C0585_00230 [Candidatus Woesearchaeota archaeon]|nr:MAG: hypothetical protein C0585_00230 [Candidatus Woesearchaeota archaeon]
MQSLELILENIENNLDDFERQFEEDDFFSLLDSLETSKKSIEAYSINDPDLIAFEKVTSYADNLVSFIKEKYFSSKSIISPPLNTKIKEKNGEEDIKNQLLDGVFNLIQSSETLYRSASSHSYVGEKEKDLKKEGTNNLKNLLKNVSKNLSTKKVIISHDKIINSKKEWTSNYEKAFSSYQKNTARAENFISTFEKQMEKDYGIEEIIDLYSNLGESKRRVNTLSRIPQINPETRDGLDKIFGEYHMWLDGILLETASKEKENFLHMISQAENDLYKNKFDKLNNTLYTLDSLSDSLERINNEAKNIEELDFENQILKVNELKKVAGTFKKGLESHDILIDQFDHPSYSSESFDEITDHYNNLNNILKDIGSFEFKKEYSSFIENYTKRISSDSNNIISLKDKNLDMILDEKEILYAVKDELERFDIKIKENSEFFELSDEVSMDIFSMGKELDAYSSFIETAEKIKSEDSLLLNSGFVHVDHLSQLDKLRRIVRNRSDTLDSRYKSLLVNLFDEHINKIYSNFNRLFDEKIESIFTEVDLESKLEKKLEILKFEYENLGDSSKLISVLSQDNLSKYNGLDDMKNILTKKYNSPYRKIAKGLRNIFVKDKKAPTKKTYVLDTNALLRNPKAMYTFEDNEVVIPHEVIQELDKKKKEKSYIAHTAREVSRELEEIEQKLNETGRSWTEGLVTTEGGIIRTHIRDKKLGNELDASMDEKIIASYFEIKKNSKDKDVRMVSNDINLRISVSMQGGKAEKQLNDTISVDPEDLYKGYRYVELETSDIEYFKSSSILRYDLSDVINNEFLIVKNKETGDTDLLLRKCLDELIVEEPKIENVMPLMNIKPKNYEQHMAMILLRDYDRIKVVYMSGIAGTGKTLLALASSLNGVEENHFSATLLSKAPTGMGDDLGILPGDVGEKLEYDMHSYNDNLEFLLTPENEDIDCINYTQTKEYMAQGNIAIQPFQKIRGRTLKKTDLILDESQNTTEHEIKTFVTRLDETSRIIIMGDPGQIDNRFVDKFSNGLSVAIDRTHQYSNQKDVDYVAMITLEDAERSRVAQLYSEIL